MLVKDPGHLYELAQLDLTEDADPVQIRFVKRMGTNYPGNATAHPGVTCQEVIRVLIDRVNYLDVQHDCPENAAILNNLESALVLFELRAARLHGRTLTLEQFDSEPCDTCGHVGCNCE